MNHQKKISSAPRTPKCLVLLVLAHPDHVLDCKTSICLICACLPNSVFKVQHTHAQVLKVLQGSVIGVRFGWQLNMYVCSNHACMRDKLSIMWSVRVICDPCVVITTDCQFIKGCCVCQTLLARFVYSLYSISTETAQSFRCYPACEIWYNVHKIHRAAKMSETNKNMPTGNPLHHLDHDQGIVTFSDTIQGSLSRFYLPPTCYAPTPSLLITLALSSFLSLRFSPSFPPSLSFSLPLSVFLSLSVFLFRSLFVQVFWLHTIKSCCI